ncbi:hypothetical protein HOG98_09650 [bacterium]|jgi:ankyrin repeat protein|nr:hypothetical protein [bacterium]
MFKNGSLTNNSIDKKIVSLESELNSEIVISMFLNNEHNDRILTIQDKTKKTKNKLSSKAYRTSMQIYGQVRGYHRFVSNLSVKPTKEYDEFSQTEQAQIDSILTLINDKNNAGLKNVLNQGIDLNIKGFPGPLFFDGIGIEDFNEFFLGTWTLLQKVMVNENCDDIFRTLLESGIDVNGINTSGITPLMLSAYLGDFEQVLLLLEYGADISPKDYNHKTALYYCCDSTETEERLLIAELLLSLGSKFDVSSNEISFSRQKFSENDYFDLIKKQNKKANDNLLLKSVRYGNKKILKLLLDSMNSLSRFTDVKWAILFAVKQPSTDCLNLLINSGAPYKDRSPNGRTPLMESIEIDHFDHATLILDHMNQEIEVKKLHVLAFPTWILNNHPVVSYIPNLMQLNVFKGHVHLNPSINIEESSGCTALHLACFKGNKQLMDKIISLGGTLGSCFTNQQQKLEFVVYFGLQPFIKPLTDDGADINALKPNGETFLTDYVGNSYNKADKIPRFIRDGANIEGKNEHGRSPLFVAHKKQNDAAVTELLNLGADIYAQGNEGINILMTSMFSIRELKPKIIFLDPRLNLTNNSGETALIMATKYNDTGGYNGTGKMNFFIEMGADLTICDSNGHDFWYYHNQTSSQGWYPYERDNFEQQVNYSISCREKRIFMMFLTGYSFLHLDQDAIPENRQENDASGYIDNEVKIPILQTFIQENINRKILRYI